MRAVRLENVTTPRIYVAATRQNDGKTTTCLGLLANLKQRFKKVGYIKPVGQRFVEVDGRKIDEDTLLVHETFHPGLPLEAMSPIAVDAGFTRHYLTDGNPAELHDRVIEAFHRTAWEQDFVVIEGSGHAGVGSVFHLSNAHVAALLGSRAIIVSQGGLGKPIDEISLNLALFEKYGVEVAGVILNQVHREKMESLREFAERGLARLGLPLLGLVPLEGELRKPTLGQICREIGGRWISGQHYNRRRVGRVVIGTATSRNSSLYIEPGCLLITAGDREDLILMTLGDLEDQGVPVAGVVLTLGLLPQDGLIKVMKQKNLPFIAVDLESYRVAAMIHEMIVKTEPGDMEKIGMIEKLIAENVALDRIIKAAWPEGSYQI
jgi:BioD-like phosphotransacetylase family protein